MGTFETHLTLSAKRSPFFLVGKKLSAAIAKDARAKNKHLRGRVEMILKRIHRQFDDLIDEKIEDASEEELRKQFREFLANAEPKFEDIKADLARIKRRYGQ